MERNRSRQAFEEACRHIPGGVNSPVRAFRSVGGVPVFVERAEGSRLWDIDGNEYIDCIGSWGPMILGHASPLLTGPIRSLAQAGISYGLPTTGETQMAALIGRAYPCAELVRMVNSGTEARSLYRATRVVFTTAEGTPGLVGVPKVRAPLPALTSRQAEWPW